MTRDWLGLTSGRVVSAKPCCGDPPVCNETDGFASDFFRLCLTINAALVSGVFLASSVFHRLFILKTIRL